MRALLRSPQAPELLAAPGNAGIARDGVECVDVGAEDVDGLVRWPRERAVDLVVVGPRGAAGGGRGGRAGRGGHRRLRAERRGRPDRGLEGLRQGADARRRRAHRRATSCSATREEASSTWPAPRYPAVLKADVLAAGKGVIIAADEREAREALDVFFAEQRFGETEVVLEEFLEGEELSLLALCDGERAVPMAPAQDYKRICDGDEGPNTGGMGSYSPVPGFDAEHAEVLARAVAPADRRRAAPPRHALPRRALRRPDDDRGRAEGARVQLPLRRPRDPGRAAAAALRPARAARALDAPGRPRGRAARVVAASGR